MLGMEVRCCCGGERIYAVLIVKAPGRFGVDLYISWRGEAVRQVGRSYSLCGKLRLVVTVRRGGYQTFSFVGSRGCSSRGVVWSRVATIKSAGHKCAAVQRHFECLWRRMRAAIASAAIECSRCEAWEVMDPDEAESRAETRRYGIRERRPRLFI